MELTVRFSLDIEPMLLLGFSAQLKYQMDMCVKMALSTAALVGIGLEGHPILLFNSVSIFYARNTFDAVQLCLPVFLIV